VSEGKKPLRVLLTTSYLTLHKICVTRFSYFIKLSALARNQFVGPASLFLATHLTSLLTKPVLRYQNSPLNNYHVRSPALAVNSVCDVLFVSIETYFLYISRKPIE